VSLRPSSTGYIFLHLFAQQNCILSCGPYYLPPKCLNRVSGEPCLIRGNTKHVWPSVNAVWDSPGKCLFWWRSSAEIRVRSLIGCFVHVKIQIPATTNDGRTSVWHFSRQIWNVSRAAGKLSAQSKNLHLLTRLTRTKFLNSKTEHLN